MSSKTMRCPVDATVTRTSPVPAKVKPPAAKAAPDKGPVQAREYRIEEERIEVRESKVKGRRVKENVKVKRCPEKLKTLERVNADTIAGDCPKHGTVLMNVAIWGKEAGL